MALVDSKDTPSPPGGRRAESNPLIPALALQLALFPLQRPRIIRPVRTRSLDLELITAELKVVFVHLPYSATSDTASPATNQPTPQKLLDAIPPTRTSPSTLRASRSLPGPSQLPGPVQKARKKHSMISLLRWPIRAITDQSTVLQSGE